MVCRNIHQSAELVTAKLIAVGLTQIRFYLPEKSLFPSGTALFVSAEPGRWVRRPVTVDRISQNLAQFSQADGSRRDQDCLWLRVTIVFYKTNHRDYHLVIEYIEWVEITTSGSHFTQTLFQCPITLNAQRDLTTTYKYVWNDLTEKTNAQGIWRRGTCIKHVTPYSLHDPLTRN